ADRIALVVVVEHAADPAPRSVAGRHEPNLLIRALVRRGFPRISRERRKLLVAPLLVEQEIRLITLTALLVLGQPGRRSDLREAEIGDDLDAEEPVRLIVRLEEAVPGFVPPGAER